MVRNYKRKNCPSFTEEQIQKAIKDVREKGLGIRQAAAENGINHTTLFYRLKRENEEVKYQSKYTAYQVFTAEQENMLVDYIIKCSKMNYGLSYQLIRSLAFDYALKLNCCPEKWNNNGTAGVEWLKCFMNRHKNLTLRKPENTSLSRATSFNKTNVKCFQENYAEVLRKWRFEGLNIYNLDETGISTVVQMPKIVAEVGTKQVGQAVSGERGQLITMCCIVNAVGNALPPVFIFPRARMVDSLMSGAPEGSLGLANSPKSGWMTGSLFVKTLEHMKHHTKCSQDNKILLLLDNHETHCSLDAINFCRENGIELLTFPPHCTHRMQPLDVAVIGPFKTALAVKQNEWMINHPGQPITIHHLTRIAKDAFDLTFTRKNILSGFQKPGIWPFSTTAFNDSDFEQSAVTDRCDPTEEVIGPCNSTNRPTPNEAGGDSNSNQENHLNLPGPSSRLNHVDSDTAARSSLPVLTKPVTPESVRPFPKALPRKGRTNGRKKGKSRILTSTPEKNKIELQTREREAKKLKTSTKRNQIPHTVSKRKLFEMETESCSETTDDGEEECGSVEISDSEEECRPNLEMDENMDYNNIKEDDYLLVKFSAKKQELHFVGKVVKKHTKQCTLRFLKKEGVCVQKFIFPENEDIWPVPLCDVVCKLPQPVSSGGTKRTARILTFPVNFSNFKMG